MEKSLMKERFLHFTTAFIVCMLLGYLSHDLMNGIRTGTLIGIGFVIGEEIIEKRRGKRKQEVEKH
ncbi:hypothetical protein [Methanosarcina sp. UBA289]|uniref:hypothetical protein n=1 Tax=Methanosarcina sp. UBA289 TaxID=1915574 RepID=UPI0025D5C9FF|nr:hypothetical protein [Methanosarcina sp. UBA289]